ncbi:MAG: endo-1,3-alpha-glucanase family glycosylhydrolase [Desulfomonilaceae bacterium]
MQAALVALVTIFSLPVYGDHDEVFTNAGYQSQDLQSLVTEGVQGASGDNIIGLAKDGTDEAGSSSLGSPKGPRRVSFYRLRVQCVSTSNWMRLSVKNPDKILSLRVMSVVGKPNHFRATPLHLALEQSPEAARAEQAIGLTVDFALAANASAQPLRFFLQKGDLNGVTVRIYHVSAKDEQPLQEINSYAVLGSDHHNLSDFSVNLTSVKSLSLHEKWITRVPNQRMLWAFYYPWYRLPNWTSPRLKDHPVVSYASSSLHDIMRQIKQAQGAGIDGFISSWWGPGSYVDQNLKILLEAAKQKGFRIAIYFETLHRGQPRDEDEIFRWLAYVIATYRDHPAYMKLNGKPVIVVWAAPRVSRETWRSIFSKLRHRGLDAIYLAMGHNISFLDVFDGLHQYGVFNISDIGQVDRRIGRATRNYPLLAQDPSPKIWAAAVQPGYDERLIPKRKGLFKNRDGGAFYRSTFEAAIQSDPDWIFITTWNEWWEHTHIEPSELYGDQYLRITREFAEKWKRNRSLKLSEP